MTADQMALLKLAPCSWVGGLPGSDVRRSIVFEELKNLGLATLDGPMGDEVTLTPEGEAARDSA